MRILGGTRSEDESWWNSGTARGDEGSRAGIGTDGYISILNFDGGN